MKNSSAIKYIYDRMHELTLMYEHEKTDVGKARINKEYSFLCIARDSINKATPAMVGHDATKSDDCTCPSCGNVVSEFATVLGRKYRETYSYCKYCGQALKWR